MKRSDLILEGLDKQCYRATLKSMGFTTDDLKRPIIGIANTRSECVSSRFNLCQVTQRVRDGVYRADATPIEFGVIGDHIVIDAEKKQLDLLVPDEEIAARLAAWKRPEPKFKKGWLGLYCKIAASGSEGAVLKLDNL